MTESLNQKPDIIVKERTRMPILDIACPCDVYISETYGLTLEKYKSLLAFIEREMMPYTCDVVIIRSLDIVCKNELNVMIGMRIPKTKAKVLVKWCSTSNITNSCQIWNARCKLVKEH